MKIDYTKFLNKNMVNFFRDILIEIDKNGLQENHQLYITFDTNNPYVKIDKWLKKKYPKEMTIILQYEYWNFKIQKNFFYIELSFDNIKSGLEIPFNSVISFADPYANFGLQLKQEIKKIITKKSKKNYKTMDNIIDFKKYKKN